MLELACLPVTHINCSLSIPEASWKSLYLLLMNVGSVHTWQISSAVLVRLIKDIISLYEFYLTYILRLSQLCHLEVRQSNFLRLGKATVIPGEIT